ncbi:flagellar motor protein MotB [Massilia horti]|uniref:Flagellar motor protein MotB n=1 Tax=Massilia horti TaxID=2562153 RepID=A0A4Y9SVS3_9BURK|nr:flagellar motor protein MotB [Massilia horti]TFW29314.1 flagellar motor protein MotB [Massilia horti]
MADEGLRPIVVKRIKKGGGHHGGAWKIAYADFVTAMMAFFLLMWLLGSTTKGDLLGIAEYFRTPLKVAMSGGSGSGDSSSVIQGGGNDLTRRTGQVKKGDTPAEKKTYDLKAAKAALEHEEHVRLQALQKRIEAAIDANPMTRKFKNQLLLDITSEGLRIQIVDEQNRPMFALAKAELQPYTRDILDVLGLVLNEVPNKIGLSGHTDSTPYMSQTGYSNWELSADRANASRRELVRGGLADDKILRVVGLASAVHLDSKDPFNPINRRISIIVMNKRTEEAIRRDSSTLDVPDVQGAAASAGALTAAASQAAK